MSDPELEAMATVHGALEDLDPPARERVLRWVAAKYELTPGQLGRRPGSPGAPIDGGADTPGLDEFREVGDLVHAAQPGAGPEHALVVGYWFQEIQGRDGWTGADINSTLKNLGVGLANVTKTLDRLKAKKPALVMQVGKSGRSRQARKTYKLTTAGVREVRQMLAGGSEEVA